ncbi:MAG: flippase [Desulfotomaculaceae bacterium]
MEQSVTKRIAKNMSWLFFGNSLNGLIYLALIVYVARVLGASAFGLYQFAQAFVLYLVMLVDNGLSLLGTREIARDRAQAGVIALNLLFVRAITALIIFVLACATLFVLPMAGELRLLIGATFLFIFYRALNTEWVFAGVELMEYIPLAKIIFSGGALLLTFWLVKGPQDLLRAPIILAGSGLFSSLVFLLFLFGRKMPLRLKALAPVTWWPLFWQALPLGASIFLIQIYNNLDTIMLGFMDRPEVVGYYSAAYRVIFVCVGLFGIWQQTAMPVMSHRIVHDPEGAAVFIKKFARLTAMAFIPLTLLVYLIAPLIVGLAFGQQYAPAVAALRLLIWMVLPVTISSCYGVLILIPAGRYYDFMWAVAVGAVVNIIFNFILIPPFSMAGAAVATILAETSACIMTTYFTQRVMKLNLLKEYLLPGLLALLAVLVYWFLALCLVKLPAYLAMAGAGTGYILAYGGLLLLFERQYIFGFIKELKSRS